MIIGEAPMAVNAAWVGDLKFRKTEMRGYGPPYFGGVKSANPRFSQEMGYVQFGTSIALSTGIREQDRRPARRLGDGCSGFWDVDVPS